MTTASIPMPASDAGESRWFAAYTSPRHEKHVSRQMQNRGIQNFLPLYKSIRRWKDRRKELDLPVFPGYLFVRMALRERVSVLQVPGVVQLVSFQGRPTPLPDAEIEMLQRQLCQSGRLQPHPFLTVGRRVRVMNGPMAGIEGILARKKDKFRVVLSIELIQRSVAVEIDLSDIEPA
jgi:transcription termination/antitermination protein NusG